MSAKSKEQLELRDEEASEESTVTETPAERREVYLREGRTLSIAAAGRDELLEIRSSSGQVELRIKLTEDGPVLQMESAKLELKATESIALDAKRVEIRASERVQIESGNEVNVEAEGEVHVNGKMIWLN